MGDIKVYVDFWEMEPSDSDFFETDSDEEFPKGDDLDLLDDDSEADEDRPQDKRIGELSRENIMQLKFTDEEAVYRFYKTYAIMHGFTVRLDEVRRDSDGCVIMRQIVCNRAGSRKEEVEKDERIRDHRPLTRSGYANLSFNQKDMYILITQHRKEKVKGGDANAVISYLRGKAGNNSSFFGKYTLSNENRLENLFWADETSRIDYECFGDVLTFDSTYNRNVYNKPLVIFFGSNHHG
ncbi:protein FAR1-RELATED SEQUENCE 5-like [Arachis stenosperma]|uniref:protein FAR1-RELATED SEQUENCE 5-like n=1 Tax=Arachis stenosperma TaxID=217475 RepID=UPI0025AD2CD3|nr:protein FAR1-RELATED SEQUENCE 5-like [Arachis stenosperma]